MFPTFFHKKCLVFCFFQEKQENLCVFEKLPVLETSPPPHGLVGFFFDDFGSNFPFGFHMDSLGCWRVLIEQ